MVVVATPVVDDVLKDLVRADVDPVVDDDVNELFVVDELFVVVLSDADLDVSHVDPVVNLSLSLLLMNFLLLMLISLSVISSTLLMSISKPLLSNSLMLNSISLLFSHSLSLLSISLLSISISMLSTDVLVVLLHSLFCLLLRC